MTKGFTLAEVLITLGIIGIVAALTIPQLVIKYQEKAKVSQLKKAYSALQQAYMRATVEYGTVETWNLSKTTDVPSDAESFNYSGPTLVAKRICEFLQTKQFCEAGDTKCIGFEKAKNLNGRDVNTSSKNRTDPGCRLIDGSTFIAGWTDRTPDVAMILPHKDKNVILGKDMFYFQLVNAKVIPDNEEDFAFAHNCKLTGNGRGCSAWVLKNENMDYLHCDGLNWSTKTSCK